MVRIGTISLCLLLLTSIAVPAQSKTITAASCSAPDVQSAINTAVTGDTVYVPIGSCNWGTTTVAIDGKSITVQGAGIDLTNITGTGAGAAGAFRIGSQAGTGNSSRITGFTITVPDHTSAVAVDGDGWRVDHMKLISATSGVLADGVLAYGLRPEVPFGPTGLIDHVTFIDSRPMIYGYPDLAQNSGSLWVSPLGLGDGNAVYIEDSTWTFNGGQANLIDCNQSGRWVLRFNTMVGSSIDSHSAQGTRGCRRWEVYNNTVNFNQPYFTPLFIRGGTGTIFNNIISTGWSEPYLSFDVVRSFTREPYLGQCDGTSPADGNVLPNGWPCRDQIGWAQDSYQWTSGNQYPKQISTPAYFWRNSIGGKAAAVNIRNGVGMWVQPNRDYYNENALFNGTTGVGAGPIASRPTACTTGVAYWATDEGEWNSNQAGPDGQLYKCTASNAWTLYYRPFPYPHPLQSATKDSVAVPDIPTNLQIK